MPRMMSCGQTWADCMLTQSDHAPKGEKVEHWFKCLRCGALWHPSHNRPWGPT